MIIMVIMMMDQIQAVETQMDLQMLVLHLDRLTVVFHQITQATAQGEQQKKDLLVTLRTMLKLRAHQERICLGKGYGVKIIPGT